MQKRFSRSRLVLGESALDRLEECRVAIFGVGGVGGGALEALARGGIGTLDIIDNDDVDETNINRQLIALSGNIGQKKVDVAEARILEINPSCRVNRHDVFFLPETAGEFDFSAYDYVLDCIDTVKGKLQLIEACEAAGTPIICAMGAGNKVDPTKFEVADIYKTSVDPLARVIRRECKKRGIRRLKVVYSKEEALPPLPYDGGEAADPGAGKGAGTDAGPGSAESLAPGKHQTTGSVSFVPPVMGMIMAGEVIKDLISFDRDNRK